jgi:hypothetical protein
VGLSFDTVGNGVNSRDAQISAINDGTNKVDLLFKTVWGALPAERMRITSDGNVGISTSSPNVKLSVGSGGGTALDGSELTQFSTTGSSVYSTWRTGSDSTIAYMGALDSTGVFVGSATNSNLMFYTNASNRMTIKNDGSVGINTANPITRLEVNGTTSTTTITAANQITIGGTGIGSARLTIRGDSSPTAGITINNNHGATSGITIDDSGLLHIGQPGFTSRLSINLANGNVGIGLGATTGANAKLEVNGTVSATTLQLASISSNVGTNPLCYSTSTKSVTYSTACTASDIRLKKDISPLGGSLDKIMLMKPVTFHWKDAARGTGLNIGLIAQDVAKVYPELAFTGSDGLMGVDYAKLVPPLIGAVQEQQQEIKTLRAKNQMLEDRLRAVEVRLGITK